MNSGWIPLRRAKLAAKDCSVEQIRPELSSKKWPEVGDVFGTTGRGRGRTEFIDENLLFKDHSLSELPNYLSLSFNTALRQVIIKENLQTLNTVVAVQRGDQEGGFANQAKEQDAQLAPHPEWTILLSARKTTSV